MNGQPEIIAEIRRWVEKAEADVQPLNRYSIEARYPGDWEPIEEDEARNAFDMVKKIRDVVREQLTLVLSEKGQE